MNADDLRGKLAHAHTMLGLAEEAKKNAEILSDRARELGGGLLSFGGSGPQGARRDAQNAQERAFQAHHDADTRIEKWTYRIRALNHRIAEQERVHLTAEDLHGVTHVRTRTGWHEVVTVNAKTVTVKTGHSWNDRIPFDRITGHYTTGGDAA